MKSINHTKKALITSAAAILAFGAMGAHADDTLARVQELTVHYADLNLDTQAGVSTLYNRIRNAAKQVCGDVNSRRIEEAAKAKACAASAVQVSVRRVNNAKLTSEYNAHLGGAEKSISLASR